MFTNDNPPVTGLLFDVQHFSTGDGPGIRTTVFLKGCPLRCEWCHNPESKLPIPQVLLHSEKCVLCGACASVCPSGAHRVTAPRAEPGGTDDPTAPENSDFEFNKNDTGLRPEANAILRPRNNPTECLTEKSRSSGLRPEANAILRPLNNPTDCSTRRKIYKMFTNDNPPVTGLLFDVQHFSTGDGPGIRTTVFLKGCPLRCEWCHNPESKLPIPQVLLHSEKCVLCGACASVCPTGAHRVTAPRAARAEPGGEHDSAILKKSDRVIDRTGLRPVANATVRLGGNPTECLTEKSQSSGLRPVANVPPSAPTENSAPEVDESEEAPPSSWAPWRGELPPFDDRPEVARAAPGGEHDSAILEKTDRVIDKTGLRPEANTIQRSLNNPTECLTGKEQARPEANTAVRLGGNPTECLTEKSQSSGPRPVANATVRLGENPTECLTGKEPSRPASVQKSALHVFDSGACVHCLSCVKACRFSALSVAGHSVSASEVLSEVLSDRLFYECSGGGLTLSGGEPLFQPSFSLALARGAKASGISVALETSAFAPWEEIAAFLPFVDLFLVDWKCSDPAKHLLYTGVDNLLIRENIEKIDASGGKIVLRCPLIPGINDGSDHLPGIVSLSLSLKNLLGIDLEPYHSIGLSKEASLGLPPRQAHPVPNASALLSAQNFLQQRVRVPVRVM